MAPDLGGCFTIMTVVQAGGALSGRISGLAGKQIAMRVSMQTNRDSDLFLSWRSLQEATLDPA